MSNNYGRDFEDSKRKYRTQSVIASILTVVIVMVALISIINAIGLVGDLRDCAPRPYQQNSLLYAVDQPYRLGDMARKNKLLKPSMVNGNMKAYYALGEYFENTIIAEGYEAIGESDKAAKFSAKADAASKDIGELDAYVKKIELMLDE